MGMVAECDLCKKAQGETMDVLEVKLYTLDGNAKDVYGAMVCHECLKATGYGEFMHKFKSMGAQDLVQKQLRQQAAEAHAAGAQRAADRAGADRPEAREQDPQCAITNLATCR